ncbi:DsbA family protein [Lawsonella clevelandensis]|uniref:DsbA family protein n=1 Tax=Lawsonella clevelandensis TaxID=1528099 RepID=UPI0006B56A00|nr:thioredoxin domain-containing protein [Lawsonella clevelandensis]MDU7193422.1 thioredoxin domain-containing protein [Lawsonella clevelandensis]
MTDKPADERKRRAARRRAAQRQRKAGGLNWRSWEPWVLITIVVAIVAVIVTLIVTTNSNKNNLSSPEAQIDPGRFSSDSYGLAHRRNDGLSIGDLDAPVVLIDYGDLRCPYCAKWMEQVEPELVDKYVRTGKLRIEFRNMVLFDQPSLLGARAVIAAAQQGKGYALMQKIYSTMPHKGHGEITVPLVRKWAEELQLKDIDHFMKDAQSTKFDAQIAEGKQEAHSMGFQSVPAFLINGYPVLGARDTQTYIDIIESALLALDK